jgi:hypothetical protein
MEALGRRAFSLSFVAEDVVGAGSEGRWSLAADHAQK